MDVAIEDMLWIVDRRDYQGGEMVGYGRVIGRSKDGIYSYIWR